MAIVWRICRTPYSDLTGEGARRHGGRWNSPGVAVVYAAEAAALAVLEVRVHLDLTPDLLPDDYELISIDVGDAATETVSALPEDPQAVGDRWIRNEATAVLSVPSTIVPESANWLLNPRHPAASSFRIAYRRHFQFDSRLWRPFAQTR